MRQASSALFFPIFKKERSRLAPKQNITIGVSFGASRDLSFLKMEKNNAEDACRICFPQPNNGVLTFGKTVNAKFKHAINAVPESEQEEGKGGRISIILWGNTTTMVDKEYETAPTVTEVVPAKVEEATTVIEEKKDATENGKKEEKKELTPRQKRRIEKRRAQRKAWQQKRKEAQAAKKAAKTASHSGDERSVDGEVIEA